MKKYLLLSLLFCGQILAADFTDTQNHPYEDAIDSLSRQGIIKGYEDGSFQPEADINRAEFVKILLESHFPFESDKREHLNPYCFTDLKIKIHWYSGYACLAKEKKILDGYPDGSFRPDFRVNRAQAAKILYQVYFGPTSQTSDVWYQIYLNLLKEKNLFLEPFQKDINLPLTRGEMAYLIDSFNASLNKKIVQNKEVDIQEQGSVIANPIKEVISVSQNNELEGVSPLRVITTSHPGQNITGGYISNYDQWIKTSYPPSLSNHTLTDEEEKKLATQVLSSVNKARIEAGVSAFEYNQLLQDLSQQFAEHVVINGFYSHSDKLGQNPIERAAIVGYPGFVAESIVWRKRTPESAITWWKKSALHWKNISNPRFKKAGVGISKEPSGGYVVVLLTGE